MKTPIYFANPTQVIFTCHTDDDLPVSDTGIGYHDFIITAGHGRIIYPNCTDKIKIESVNWNNLEQAVRGVI